jgi:hypothetical protein
VSDERRLHYETMSVGEIEIAVHAPDCTCPPGRCAGPYRCLGCETCAREFCGLPDAPADGEESE